MCGIFGIFGQNEISMEDALLEQCANTLRHRGPDHIGFVNEPNYRAASLRLAVIDLETGDQPVYSADKRYSIVYNGVIYNHRTLRQELAAKGVCFRTNSDTEVLLQMYIVYGKDMIPRLEGQFAFLIYDRDTKTLFGARDRFGICPLYFTQLSPGTWAFASEIKAFEPFGVSFELDPMGVQQIPVFWACIPPRTCWKNIFELPIARFFTVTTKTPMKHERYFSFNENSFANDECASISDALEKTKEILSSEIQKHLAADVPIGSYLSGGIDSSVLASMASRFMDKLNTFSVGFDDEAFDETEEQRKVLDYIPNANHHHVQVTSDDIIKNLPGVVFHTEKPLFRTAPTPLYLLSKAVRDSGVKAVLTGEGSDEIFLGYDTYRELLIRTMWARNPDSEWRPQLFSRIFPYFPQYRDKRAFQFLKAFYKKNLLELDNPFYPMLPRFSNGSQIQKICIPELLEPQDELDSELLAYIGLSGQESLQEKCQLIELHTLLPGYLLSSQGDRMLSAHSVEGRYPYLSNRLSQFLWHQPEHWKLFGLRDKSLLRQAVKGLIPESVRTRPKFAYRSPDINAFFPAPPGYVEDLFSKRYAEEVGLFVPDTVDALFKKFCTLKKGQNVTLKDSVSFVWILTTHLLHYRFSQKGDITQLDMDRRAQITG